MSTNASVGRVDLDLGINYSTAKSQLTGISSLTRGSLIPSFSKLGAIAGAAFSIRKLTQFTKESLNLGSSLREVQNVVDVTFRDMSSRVNDFSQTTIETLGMSELSAKKFTSAFGAMMKSSGITDKSQLTDMSIELTKLTGDFASFYNMDYDDAFLKIQSGMAGMTRGLRSVGKNLTVANIEQYALSQGFTKSYKSMDSAEKTLWRYNYLMSLSVDTQGDFVRTQHTWANQTRMLGEQWQATMATFGQGMINALAPVVSWLNVVVMKLRVAAEWFSALTEVMFGNTQRGSGGTAIEDITNQYDDLGNSAEGASEEMKKALAPFDQLNLISDETNSDTDFDISAYVPEDPYLGIDSEEIGKHVAELESMIAEFALKYREEIATIKTSTDRFDNSLGDLAESFGELRSVIFGGSGESNWFTKMLANVVAGQIRTANSKVMIFTGNLQILTDWLQGDFNSAEGFETLIFGATEAMLGFTQSYLPKELYEKMDGIATKNGEMWSKIKGNVKTYGDPAKLEFSDFIDAYSDIVDKGTFPTVWEALWDKITGKSKEKQEEALTDFNGFLQDEHDSFDENIRDSLPVKFTKLGIDIRSSFKESMDPLVDYTGEVLKFAKANAIRKFDNWIFDMSIKAVQLQWELTSPFRELKSAMGGLWDDITDAFDKAFEGFSQGMEISMGGLETVMSSPLRNIALKINDFIESYNSLGVSLPSINFGGHIVEGIDWKVPQISPINVPALAEGGLISAPTLALVGDNKGANTDPEVVAPLSKLEGMINSGGTSKEVITLLKQILTALSALNLTLQIGETEFGKASIKAINKVHRQTGSTLLIV